MNEQDEIDLPDVRGLQRLGQSTVYAAAAELGDAEYRADHGAFFGSVHGTLNHLLVGDRIWMQRLSVTLNVGDVFTIGALTAGVLEVNPVTKVALPFLKQFRVVSYASNSLVFAPAIIWTGPFQSAAVVKATDLNSQAITGVGTNGTLYRQNLMFHKNAFAFPMEKPCGTQDLQGSQRPRGAVLRWCKRYF